MGRHTLCLTSGFLFKPQLSLVSPSCGFLKHGSGRISPLDSSLPPPGVTFEAAVCLTPFSVSVPHLDTQRALQPAPLTLPHGHTSVLSQHPLPACSKHPCPAQASQRGKCPSGSRSALLPGRGDFWDDSRLLLSWMGRYLQQGKKRQMSSAPPSDPASLEESQEVALGSAN